MVDCAKDGDLKDSYSLSKKRENQKTESLTTQKDLPDPVEDSSKLDTITFWKKKDGSFSFYEIQKSSPLPLERYCHYFNCINYNSKKNKEEKEKEIIEIQEDNCEKPSIMEYQKFYMKICICGIFYFNTYMFKKLTSVNSKNFRFMTNYFGLQYNFNSDKISKIEIRNENNLCETFSTPEEINKLKKDILHRTIKEKQITKIEWQEQSTLTPIQKRRNILELFEINDEETYKKIKQQLQDSNFLVSLATVPNHCVTLILDLSYETFDDFLKSSQEPVFLFDSSHRSLRNYGTYKEDYKNIMLEGCCAVVNSKLQHLNSGSCTTHAFAAVLTALGYNNIDELKKAMIPKENCELSTFDKKEIYHFHKILLEILQQYGDPCSDLSKEKCQEIEKIKENVNINDIITPKIIAGMNYFKNEKDVADFGCKKGESRDVKTVSQVMGQEDKSFNIDEGVTFNLREVLRDVQEKDGEGDNIIEKIEDFIFKLVMRQVKFPDSFCETQKEKQNIAKLFLSVIAKEKIQEIERDKKEKIKEGEVEEECGMEEEIVKQLGEVFLEIVEENRKIKFETDWRKYISDREKEEKINKVGTSCIIY